MPDYIKYKIPQKGICNICGKETSLIGEDYSTKLKICSEDFEHLAKAHALIDLCIQKQYGIEHPKRV